MIKCCQIGFFIIKYHNTSWSAPHIYMLPPNLPKLRYPGLTTSCMKIKCVVAWWIPLLTMQDGRCSFSFVKVSDPNIINAAAKAQRITCPLVYYTHRRCTNDMKTIENNLGINTFAYFTVVHDVIKASSTHNHLH